MSTTTSRSRRVTLARALAACTVLYGAVFYALGAAMKPGYSSATQFISELNATGTAYAERLGWLGFLPVALLSAAFLVAGTPVARVVGASRLGWWLLASVPLAFLGVAAFPCDAGCPIGGSPTQAMHDLIALATYFASAAALALLAFAPAHPAVSKAVRGYLFGSAVLFLVLFVAMLDPGLAPVRGSLQRVADGLLGGALLVVAWRIVRRDE